MILVSAFSPFDVDPENSTELIIESAKEQNWTGVSFVTLPVSFSRAWSTLKQAIDQCRPTTVLSLGQADSRDKISIERVALNWQDARILDGDGKQPVDEPIQTLGPLALPARLPTRSLVSALSAVGLPAELSYFAGTYVCNALMYDLLYWAEQKGCQAGFVHFPLLVDQKLGPGREAKRPAVHLTLDRAVLALQTLIKELA